MSSRDFAVILIALLVRPSLADEWPGAAATIWEGVYTSGQAARGERIYPSICGRCHGYKMDGAPDDPDFFPTPPIAGRKFLRKWDGVTLGVLLAYTRESMPEINPGSLSDQEFADVVSYMLAASGAPPGGFELPAEAPQSTQVLITPGP